MSAADLFSLNLINNFLVSTCREMGIAMMRTAFSPIFNEGLDFSCVIFTRDGEMIAQADYVPSMVGSILYTVKWTIEELGLDYFHEGDVIIHNDPYRGGCHLPEHMFLKPVFYDGDLVGFVATIGHITEIGGKAIGGFAADATDVFQEGLRIPPIRIVNRGELVEDVWKLVLNNHRTPRNTWGDFHAMIGSLRTGEQRVQQLLKRHGKSYVESTMEGLLQYAEQYMRAEIRSIPNGEYTFEDMIEDDGVEPDRSYRIRATLIVDDDQILVDFTGSSPQATGAINCTFGVTASATYNALLQVTDASIPRNAGCYRPIRLIAPAGTVVNVSYPGPEVGGNSEIHGRIVDLLLAALWQAIPKRVAASSGGSSMNFLFGGGHPDTGATYAGYHFEGVGYGGQDERDGMHVVSELGGNCRNTPVEIFESRYPWRVLRYSLAPDSGGPGLHRGGCGSERVLEVCAPRITVSAVIDRLRQPPYGLSGGREGGCAQILIKRSGEHAFRSFRDVFGTAAAGKFSGIVLHQGDQVLLRSPGGGGYGNPRQRPRELVIEDLREGLISVETAAKFYGSADDASSNEGVT